LHDRALQLISTIRLRAEVCRRELMDKPQELEQALFAIEKAAESVVAEIRRILADNQMPSDLVAGTLERRLKEEMEIFRTRSGLKLDFQCKVGPHTLPYEVERELYFTLREGVINAIRHSRASELLLRISQEGNVCKAILADNGSGFDLSETEGSSHYGLRIMRERIQKLGGQFVIDTTPGSGTQIVIDLPIKEDK
jgi:two-component system, NarL family, sensor histidine kinase DegS